MAIVDYGINVMNGRKVGKTSKISEGCLL